MLEEKLTEEDIEFIETMYHPRACAECLFSNHENLCEMDEDKFLNVRIGQFPLLSYEYLIDENPELSEKENLKLRKGAGELYCYSAREFGKTWAGEKLDFNIYAFHAYNEKSGFNSFDHKHLQYILDELINVWEYHPIMNMFKSRTLRNPYLFFTRNGIEIIGINSNNSKGTQAGDDFLQKHLKRLFMEEASKEIKAVHDKRIHSVSEVGCIFRFFGMTDFTKNSPPGEIFKDKKMRRYVLNLPQYINPNFDEEDDEKAQKEYHGKQSIGYKVYVGGEIVEEGISVVDMERVRRNCIAKGSKVLMSDFSVKNIEEVQIGDKILTFEEEPHKSRYRKFKEATVLDTIYQGKKQIYDFRVGSNNISATFDHLVLGKLWGNGSMLWHNIMGFAKKQQEICSLNNFITNQEKFIEGVLIGFLDAEEDKNSKYNCHRFFQKTEIKAIEWVLKELKLQYSKTFLKRDKGYYYYIKTKYKEYISSIYNNLISDKNVQIGYISGMVLGDGTVTKHGFSISQKEGYIFDRIEKVLDLLNIKYRKQKIYTRDRMWNFCLYLWEILPNIKNSIKVEKFKKRLLSTGCLTSVKKQKISLIGNKRVEKVYDLTTTEGTFIVNGVLVHNCYPHKNGEVEESLTVKSFEIDKKTFNAYKMLLITARPSNADTIGVYADIGNIGGTSELIVVSKTDKKYRYLYNITLRNLTEKQQYEIFKYLYNRLNLNYIGLDTTDGSGRAIYGYLDNDKDIKEGTLIWVGFNEKLKVGFEVDEKGNPKIVNKDLVYKYERTDDWSIQRLVGDILYEGLIYLPFDYKLDEQLNSVMAITLSNGIHYQCVAPENHLFQAFQVFSVSDWMKQFEGFVKEATQSTKERDWAGA